jgi:FKBP-type peptidyl-prolyl cis-trans isomerase FkpA
MKLQWIAILGVVLLAAPVFAVETPVLKQENMLSEDQKTLYALGQFTFRTLAPFNLSPAELEIVKQGITDAGIGKKPAVELSAYDEKVQQLFLARRKAEGEKSAGMNKGLVEKMAKEKGAVKTGSGLVYRSLKNGSGASPSPTDTVRVNYRGAFPDGKEFASSYKKGKEGEPIELKMDGVIKCWKEGLQKMKTGGKARLVCPPDLAYGDEGAGDLILPYATLVFEVELLEVKQ